MSREKQASTSADFTNFIATTAPVGQPNGGLVKKSSKMLETFRFVNS